MDPARQLPDRAVLALSGDDRVTFLQDLVSSDVRNLDKGPAYAALLTPQGKYLFDFFVVGDGERILLDVAAETAPQLAQRLNMYRLRAKVAVEATDLKVAQGLGASPNGGFADPRHEALGWRLVAEDLDAVLEGRPVLPAEAWDALRVAHGIPETGLELVANDTLILEVGFDRLHGVDFKKGCYVGQEVTARMRHKTELRKGLALVDLSEPEAPGTQIMAEGKAAGTLHTVSGTRGLAHLRFDRAKGEMTAGAATLRRLDAPWSPIQ